MLNRPPDFTAFVRIFREAGLYINGLKDKTIVIGVSADLFNAPAPWTWARDLNLLHSLGLRIVIVFGIVPAEQECREAVIGVDRLQELQALSGSIRVNIISSLRLGINDLAGRGQKGLNIVSADYISARPQGVTDGIDRQRLGQVRKINAELLSGHLAAGNLVLIEPLGYAAAGTVYYLPAAAVAGAVAEALGAEKLIFLNRAPGINDGKGELITNLTLSAAREVTANVPQSAEITAVMPAAAAALASGRVKRVQMVGVETDGAILAELFTRGGAGTALSYSSLQNIRVAAGHDIPALLELIAPLIAGGLLLPRDRNYFETFISRFRVVEFDNLIYGCAEIKFYAGDCAELACLAVVPEARDTGYGDDLLAKAVEEARLQGKKRLLAVTTQAADWFGERGFSETDAAALPAARRAEYDHYKRHGKVLSLNL